MCHPEPLAKDLSKSDGGRTIPEILEFLFVASARQRLLAGYALTLIATSTCVQDDVVISC